MAGTVYTINMGNFLRLRAVLIMTAGGRKLQSGLSFHLLYKYLSTLGYLDGYIASHQAIDFKQNFAVLRRNMPGKWMGYHNENCM